MLRTRLLRDLPQRRHRLRRAGKTARSSIFLASVLIAAAIILGLRWAGTVRHSEAAPDGSAPKGPALNGGGCPFSGLDRAISGYTWESPDLVPPRDDGVFRLAAFSEGAAKDLGIEPGRFPFVWKHPYGGGADLPILMYHSISRPAKNLCVTPEDFRDQMLALRSGGYTGIPLETALLYARGIPVRMPPKPVVLTFDDGYKDFTTAAIPVLKEFGFRATVFIIAELVEKPGYMTWEDVKQAAGAGHEVGCHSMTHPDLRNLDDAALRLQILAAKDVIEAKSGIRPKSFCYPSGRYNEPVLAMTRSGYLGAVTTSTGWASMAGDLYVLKRIRVNGLASVRAFESQLRIARPE